MKLIYSLLLVGIWTLSMQSQQKNFIDQAYVEVTGSADTLVTPDRIYLDILISEEDTKGKTSVEELEAKMISELKTLDINIEEQLFVADASSSFQSYFLSGQKVLKTKQYTLLTYKASTLGRVLERLQKINIANVMLNRIEHSQIDALQTSMKAKAVINAKTNAKAMTDALDQSLGKAIFISESNAYSHGVLGRTAGMQIRELSSVDDFNQADLSFDQIEVKGEVSVRFILN